MLIRGSSRCRKIHNRFREQKNDDPVILGDHPREAASGLDGRFSGEPGR